MQLFLIRVQSYPSVCVQNRLLFGVFAIVKNTTQFKTFQQSYRKIGDYQHLDLISTTFQYAQPFPGSSDLGALSRD